MKTFYTIMCLLLHLLQRYWIAITIMLLIAITALSLWPLKQLPGVAGTDKAHHFIAYAALAFPVALRQPRYCYQYLLILIGWGGAIELIQPYVNRYGEWLDLAANTGGVASGYLLAHLMRKLTKLKPYRK